MSENKKDDFEINIDKASKAFEKLVAKFRMLNLSEGRLKEHNMDSSSYLITLWGEIGKQLCSSVIDNQLLNQINKNRINNKKSKINSEDIKRLSNDDYRDYMCNVFDAIGIGVFAEIGEAVRALNHGDVYEILKVNEKNKSKHGDKYELSKLKGAIVSWLYYFYGSQKGRKSKKRAVGDIAKYTGFSDTYIRNVESEFKKIYPEEYGEIVSSMSYAGKYNFRVYKNSNKATNKAVEKFILNYRLINSNNRKSYRFKKDLYNGDVIYLLKNIDDEISKQRLHLLGQMYPLWDLGSRLKSASKKSATKS